MAINPLNSSQSHDRTGQEGFSPLPSLDFRSILTQLGIWGFRAAALGFPRETTVGVMGESSPKGQWRGSAGKGQEGPHWEGTVFGGEGGVPWVCVPSSPGLTLHPIGRACLGLTKGISEGFSSIAKLAKSIPK